MGQQLGAVIEREVRSSLTCVTLAALHFSLDLHGT